MSFDLGTRTGLVPNGDCFSRRDTAPAMSEQRIDPVRQPIRAKVRPRRAIDERLLLRFPRGFTSAAQLVWKLPPRSRLRMALVGRVATLAIEAHNRGDLEAAVAVYDSEVEYVTPPQIIPLGFEPIYRGRDARIEVQRRWTAEWGEFTFKPEELIDVGDGRVLMLGRMEGSGLTSGVMIDNDWADLFTIARGRVVREQVYLDRAEALEAAGLSE